MNRILQISKKTVLALAILLMTTASAWAEVITITISNGQNVTAPYTIPSTATVVIHITSGTGTYSGVISGGNSSSCTITKTGAGKVIISNANTVSGTTISVNAGTLQLGNGATDGTFNNMKSVSVASGATLRFEPGTYGGVFFSKPISGAGEVRYLGSDAKFLMLNSSITTTGTTTIESGEFALYSTGSITGNIVVQSGGILIFERSSDYTYSGVISGAGDVYHNGSNKTILTGKNTYTGKTEIWGGTLQVGNGTSTDASIGNTSDVFINNSTLRFEPGASMSFSKVIDGQNAKLVYKGTATKPLYLTANHIGTITTTIESGNLYIGNGGTTGSLAGDVNVQSGALLFYRSNQYTYSGIISGAGEVWNYGTGKTILTGKNTYTGKTSISFGTLQVGNGTSTTATIGSTSGVTLSTATTVLRFEPGANIVFSKEISGAGKLECSGSSSSKGLYLSANNTYTGTTTINGYLYIGNGGTTGSIAGDVIVQSGYLTFHRSNEYTFSKNISGSGNIWKMSSGKTILTGANTFTGSTTVAAGTLQVGNGTSTTATIGATSGVTLSSSTSVLRFEPGDNTTFSKEISGDGKVEYLGSATKGLYLTANNTYTGTTTINGYLYLGNGGTAGSIAGDIIVQSGYLTFHRSNEYTFSKIISGSGNIWKMSSGKTILTGANTFTGSTTVAAGTLQVGNGTGITASIETTALVTLSSATAVLRFEPGYNMVFTKVISGEGKVECKGGTSKSLNLTAKNKYTGTTTIESGALGIGNNTTSGAIAGNIINYGSLSFYCPQDYTYSGVISGSGSVYKISSGKLILTGANTYGGETRVNDGTLQVGNGTSTTATIGSTSGVTLSSSTSVLRFEPGDNMAFSKVIDGSGKVEYKGSGTKQLSFTANNTYSGTTTIESGTLCIGEGTNTGSIAGNVINNGILRFFRSNACIYDGVISGSGIVSQGTSVDNAGTLTLRGVNTYTGETWVFAPLVLSSSGSIENSSMVLLGETSSKLNISEGNKKIKALYNLDGDIVGEVVLGTRTLTIGTAGQNDGGGSFGGKFTGTGSVTKTGMGTFTMYGANTATGTFTHSQGTVNLSGTWAGNYNKAAGTTLTVTGNPTIGGTLTLAGGDINMNLTASTPSKLTVTGAVSATETNTLNITTNAINNCVLIQAASGIFNTTPYTVNLPTLYSHLLANGTQLALYASQNSIVPEITTTTLPSGVEGTLYNETLTATGLAPITWSFEGGTLPGGLSLAPNGVLSGTPTAIGTFTFTVKVTNVVGSDVKGLSITITDAIVAPTITTTTLSDGTIGLAYNGNFVAEGSSPITWTVQSGNLPAGLTLSTTGVISGTPTAVETSTFTVKATNSAGSDTKSLSITINGIPPTITTTTLPGGLVGTTYSEQLDATGTTPITWTVQSGNLPAGLTLSTTGLISGTPTTIETSTFTVKATNSADSDTKSLSITINGISPTITTTTLPSGLLGTTYSQQLDATGTTPITWTLQSGNLPAGLTLSTTGLISGTPTAIETSSFTVKATNSAGSDTKSLNITINGIPPTITTTTLPGGLVGTTYSQQLNATGTTPITWSLESGSLPSGLNLYGSGEISGTPTVNGTFTFTVKAANSAGQDTKELTIKIEGLGIETITNDELRITVYPNPTTGELRIENGEWRIENVEIYDIMGRKQKAESRKGEEEIVLNISNLPAGVYFLRIQTETGTVTQKVIKQ